ncbi:peptidoglycan-binding protein [Eubacteriales bacterium OttesenSCG-928-A19]|nr:peptidoglycan-binding protein [Eubacteriales bacterium OttesenSCG-928-A19]
MSGYTDPPYWRANRIVTEVQRLLVLGGKLNSTDIDGQYGTRTQNAIKTFQRIYGLSQDGIWGRQCWGITEQGYL